MAPAPQFIMPVAGPVTSGYGYRSFKIGGSYFHPAIDIGALFGSPVRAAAAGTVTSADWNTTGYGLLVILDHGAGTTTRYAHLSHLGVRVNEHVTQGQIIGWIGASGAATGPHLHFEIRRSSEPVNPAPLLAPTNPTLFVNLPAISREPVPPLTLPSTAFAGRFFVQVGAFRYRENAEALVALLTAQQASASERPNRDGLTRVWVGPFANRSIAQQALEVLHQNYADAYIVQP
ncbi:MAG: peptidoglycan DD-metalloendopeptidase family protein [Deinococcus sp.]|nr:peptidoglycan DD-metalloendopeptidase family protein [Deinococcus sp.]